MGYTRIVVLLVAGSAGVQAQPEVVPRDFTWAQHPKLTWDDFKDHPPKLHPWLSAGSGVGQTVMLFCYENGLLDVRVDANFSPGTSWVRLKDESGQLLKHEQGHFDITEPYARKLRKVIRDAQIRCSDEGKESKGHLLINRLRKEYKVVEQHYDIDTKHGADSGRQSRASAQIESDVAALGAYRQ